MSVQTQIDRLNAIKSRMRTNLVAQGVTVPADTVLDEMATMVLSVAGEDGTSVSIANIEQSEESGGTSTVTFSDGNKLEVKNGEDGNNEFYMVEYNNDGTVTLPNEEIMSESRFAQLLPSLWKTKTVVLREQHRFYLPVKWEMSDRHKFTFDRWDYDETVNSITRYKAVIDTEANPSIAFYTNLVYIPDPATLDNTPVIYCAADTGTGLQVGDLNEDGGITPVSRSDFETQMGTSPVMILSYLDGEMGAIYTFNAVDPESGAYCFTRMDVNGNKVVKSTITLNADDTVTKTVEEITVEDGYTPVKGTDYWTPADQESIVQQVITALGTPVFGTVDLNKRITLSTEHLAEGTYELGYEDKYGNWVAIGTLKAEGEPTYTNVLPLAINSDGTPYNGGQGWKAGTRLNSSGAESTSNATEIEVTGFIPVKVGDKVYLKDIIMNMGTYANQTYIWFYDSSFTKLSDRYKLFSQYSGSYGLAEDIQKGYVETDTGDISGNITMITIYDNAYITYTNTSGGKGDLNNVAYFRISCEGINSNSIITVNEPIE